MPRNVQTIDCKICNEKFSSVGLATHLRTKHNITNDEYVSRYGEFRKNILKKVLDDTEECLICKDGSKFNTKGLSWHLRQVHNLSKIDYVKQYILNNIIPTCNCGCGSPLTIKHYKPYIVTEYIAGHNSKGNLNPNYGKRHSDDTKQKMKIAGNGRIQRTNDRWETDWNVSVTTRKFSPPSRLEYTFTCNTCNTIFTRINPVIASCPACNPFNRSRGEREIMDYIKQHLPGATILTGNRTLLPSKTELDIVLPEYKIAIEFDGLYWHGELAGKHRLYHLKKTTEAESIGYKLFHVFEDEWNDNRTCVIERIISATSNCNRQSVYARQCSVLEITASVANEFLNNYHLQGKCQHTTRLGLFNNGELLQVMTFSKPNASHGSYKSAGSTMELSRLCTKHGVRIIGGASKLLNYFINTVTHVDKLLTYADKRYSTLNNTVYEKIGFQFIKTIPPTYWYVKRGTSKKYHRFNFTKKKTIQLGGVSTNTEWENMQLLGYDRIWDCGKLKYEMILK